jgi:hypothetical protein
VLTGSTSTVDREFATHDVGAIPGTVRARISSASSAGSASAGFAVNYVGPSNALTVSIHPGDPNVSATVYSLTAGGITTLASCPAGRVSRNTWYIIELRDTSSGLTATVFDDTGTTTICLMQVNGSHVTNSTIGVVAVRAGGATLVDWIEAGTPDGGAPPATTYTISGTVSGAAVAGVTVMLSGATSATTTTSGTGTFTFTGHANGSYIVTPSLAGFTFSPASIPVTVSGTNVSGVNFQSASASVSRYCTFPSDNLCQEARGTTIGLDAIGANQASCTASNGISFGVPCATTNYIGQCSMSLSMSGYSFDLLSYFYPPAQLAHVELNCKTDGGTFIPGNAVATSYCAYGSQSYCLEATGYVTSLVASGTDLTGCQGTGGTWAVSCDPSNRLGRCAYVIPGTSVTAIRHWYAPKTLVEIQTDCTARGGTFTPN